MMEGPNPWDPPAPTPPRRWQITRKLRAWLIRIKDLLIYQTGAYPHETYSFTRFSEGMLSRPRNGKKYTRRWDALFGRWKDL